MFVKELMDFSSQLNYRIQDGMLVTEEGEHTFYGFEAFHNINGTHGMYIVGTMSNDIQLVMTFSKLFYLTCVNLPFNEALVYKIEALVRNNDSGEIILESGTKIVLDSSKIYKNIRVIVGGKTVISIQVGRKYINPPEENKKQPKKKK